MDDEIRFFMPDGETVPLEFSLYVDGYKVIYDKVGYCRHEFYINVTDSDLAMKLLNKVISRILKEKPYMETVSIERCPSPFNDYTCIEWEHKLKDNY